MPPNKGDSSGDDNPPPNDPKNDQEKQDEKPTNRCHLTEEQFQQRLAAETEPLQDMIDGLEREVSDAVEALRALPQVNSDNTNEQVGEVPEDTRPLREQISDLGEEVQRCKAELQRQKKKLAGRGIATICDDIKTENEILKKEVSSKDEFLQNLAAANLQLDEDFQTLKKQLERRTPASSGDDAANLASLEDSNKILRESNENLREEVQTLKINFAAAKKQREELKDSLRELNRPGESIGPAVNPGGPEVARLKERVEELEDGKEQLTKEFQESKERYEKDVAATNAKCGRLELENNRLQGSVADRNITILNNLKLYEEMNKELQDKANALEAAKADREAQLQRQKRRIAELEGRESDSGNSTASSNQLKISSGDRDDVQPPAGVMEVVIMRCELALGQLQAQRKRFGYLEGDALLAISVTQEAQGMAERLEDLAWIGRAAFWRGIAEWMGGNSTTAEGFFENSASHEWNEPPQERGRLQEWWDAAKFEHVDKTSRRDPDNGTPQKWPSYRPDRSRKEKKSKGKGEQKTKKDRKTEKHLKVKGNMAHPPAEKYTTKS